MRAMTGRETPLPSSASASRSMVSIISMQREDREREDERGEDFAEHVAVDDAEHAA